MPANSRKFSLVLAAIAFIGFASGASAEVATVQDPMVRGIEEMKYNRYHAAKEEFMSAIIKNPRNQMAYLFLGRCLEYLHEWEDAQATYRACFSVNPFSKEGKAAKKGAMEVSSRIEGSKHRAIDTPELVVSSGLLIQRQSLELQARKMKEMRQFERIRRNASARSGYFYTPGQLNRARYDEYSNMEFLRNSGTLYDYSNEAAKAKLHGQQVAQNVQDTANALIARLGRKTGNGTPALRALGTNLYVQYYRSMEDEDSLPPPEDPPIELKAKQFRLIDVPSAWKAHSKLLNFPVTELDNPPVDGGTDKAPPDSANKRDGKS